MTTVEEAFAMAMGPGVTVGPVTARVWAPEDYRGWPAAHEALERRIEGMANVRAEGEVLRVVEDQDGAPLAWLGPRDFVGATPTEEATA